MRQISGFDPKFWSEGLSATRPAQPHEQDQGVSVWTWDLSLSESEFVSRAEAWLKAHDELTLSLTPGGQVLCTHLAPKLRYEICSAGEPIRFAQGSPLAFSLAIVLQDDRISKVSLRLMRPISAQGQLAADLCARLHASTFDRLALATPKLTASTFENQWSGLDAEGPSELWTFAPSTDWAILRSQNPELPAPLLAGVWMLTALRALWPSTLGGILIENGRDTLVLDTGEREARSWSEIRAALRVRVLEAAAPRYAILVSMGPTGLDAGSSERRQALTLILNEKGEPSALWGSREGAASWICDSLVVTREALTQGGADVSARLAARLAVRYQQQNRAQRPYKLKQSVTQLLAPSFTTFGEQMAVQSRSSQMSYRELDRLSTGLACYLAAQGVGPGQMVGVALDREPFLLVTLLAIWKSGAGYVPLDPNFPEARLRYMLEDSQVSCCIAEDSFRPIAATLTRCLDPQTLRAAAEEWSGRAEANTLPESDPESTAYIIYTSGSTGLPKGVVLPHRAVVNFLLSMQEAPGLAAGDRLLAVTTLSFDIAVLELYLPLLCGATICLAAAGEAKDGASLKALMDDYRITHFQATASTYRVLLDAGWQGRLKKALCGGEAFPLDVARRLRDRSDEIWNMYGPTETTVWSSVYRLDGSETLIPIGWPIANTSLYVLNDSFEVVAPGEKGEIFIGGAGLAKGYLRRPELNAERFIEAPGTLGTLYRTGDIGSFRWDGCLMIYGRADAQVKLRGYRMELGEIEAAVASDHQIEIAVVAVKNFGDADDRLVAYIKTRSAYQERALRQALKERLPEYMLPQHFIVLENFVLTPNGKIDRKALPDPTGGSGRDGPKAETKTRLQPSSSQARMLYVEQLDPETSVHNLGGAWLLPAPVSDAVILQALSAIVAKHEALRMSLADREIIVHPPYVPAIETVAVRRLEDARQHLEAAMPQRLDLHARQTWRILNYRDEQGKQVLALISHHIFWDGYSYSIFLKDWAEACRQIAEQGYAELEAPSLPYSNLLIRPEAADEDQTYWLEQFRSLPDPLEIATDYPRPKEMRHAAGIARLSWDENLDQAITSLSRKAGCSYYHIVLAAYGVFLQRLSRQSEVVIGSPVLGRQRSSEFESLGNFINVIALRFALEPEMSFLNLLQRVGACSRSAFAHAAQPFEALVAALKMERDSSRTPLYSAMLFFQDQNEPLPAGLKTFRFDRPMVDSDLVLWIERTAGEVEAGLSFRTDLWERASAEAMASAFARLLRGLLATPERPLASPSLADWARPQISFEPRAIQHLWPLLAAQAHKASIAVEGLDGYQQSYRALFDDADRLAELLVERGAQAGDAIGVSLRRGPLLIPTLLGILKLGAAYVPLDPNYPKDRLELMAHKSKARFVVCEADFAELFEGCPLVILDQIAWQERPVVNRSFEHDPASLAYVIYTSGSTGEPKGVEIPHSSVCTFLGAIGEAIPFADPLRTLAVTTISFDISVLEIFLTLSRGGTVVLVPQESVTDGPLLLEALHKQAINHLQATPASWRLLLESGLGTEHGLMGLVGGEALPKDLAAQLMPRLKSLWNVYGPTEATVWASCEQVRSADLITVGHALPGYELFVLDTEKRPLPQGVVGDLFIGGLALARGYRFRPDLTAERFLPHPDRKGYRMYDTGDLARVRADGRVEYIGRRDNQVKLRGYRIELGEIEAALEKHPDVRQAVCLVRTDGETRLVAYLLLQADRSMDLAGVQAWLRQSLPPYMLPSGLVILDAFPLTGSGKIDRKALPKESVETRVARAVEVLTPMESELAAIFDAFLGAGSARRLETFFEGGGHSLLALKVLARIKEKTGRTFTVRDLLMQNLSQLASRLEEGAPS